MATWPAAREGERFASFPEPWPVGFHVVEL